MKENIFVRIVMSAYIWLLKWSVNTSFKLQTFQANVLRIKGFKLQQIKQTRNGTWHNWRMASGIIGQVMVVVVLIIVGGVAAILIYDFQNTGSSVGNLNTDQKGNVSTIVNGGASTLQFIPLVALAIFIAIILAVLLGIFIQRRRE